MIDLSKPISSEKVRAGFQPHWRTVFVYQCPICGKRYRIFASRFQGKTPLPEIGAIYCDCEEAVKA